MNIRATIKTIVLTSALAVSATSHASERTAMAACVKAFTETQLIGHKVIGVHTDTGAWNPLTPHSTNEMRIVLSAKAADGETVASATCVANRKGEVLSMSGTPASESKVASR
jgi:hypothetical protein